MKKVEAREGEILVWTDGACRGNPGPGGWAAIVVNGGDPVELSGGAPHTTNNRMEYTAALEGLRSLPAGGQACVVTDSKLMLDSMTKWIHGWKRKGWKTAAGSPSRTRTSSRRSTRRWPATRASAGSGSRATRPASSTPSSTTAPTGSRSPPRIRSDWRERLGARVGATRSELPGHVR